MTDTEVSKTTNGTTKKLVTNGKNLQNGVKISEREFEEIQIEVPWGHVAGKWYGDRNTQPVMTFHGWQDNAGTFDRLIPLLPQSISFLCIDLPGQGKLLAGSPNHLNSFLGEIRRKNKKFLLLHLTKMCYQLPRNQLNRSPNEESLTSDLNEHLYIILARTH